MNSTTAGSSAGATSDAPREGTYTRDDRSPCPRLVRERAPRASAILSDATLAGLKTIGRNAAVQLLRRSPLTCTAVANSVRACYETVGVHAPPGLMIALLAGRPSPAPTVEMSHSTLTPSRTPRMNAANPPSGAWMVSHRAGRSLPLRSE